MTGGTPSLSAPAKSDPARVLPQLWGRRGLWQIRLRWAVAPLMAAGVWVATLLGCELPTTPILLIAAASLAYNAVFAWIYARWSAALATDLHFERRVVVCEVLADYTAMLLLVHLTGGAASPLALFLLFHVIAGAVQFSSGTAHLFAALAAAGLWLIHCLDLAGRLPSHELAFRGQPLHLLDRPALATVVLLILTATLFLAATLVAKIMQQLRGRVDELASATDRLVDLNTRLSSLYTMVRAIGAHRRLAPILETVVHELARATDVPAAAVKLLSDDGKTLRYVAAHGLPREILDKTVIRVDQSPLNRRILDGETLVHGRIGGDPAQRHKSELAPLGFRSAVLAPLTVESRVIGTLGLYSPTADRFSDRDSDFLRLAADLVALAIEDARANEAIEQLMAERTQFMLKVAHNLRSPLAAGLSMLELVAGGLLGPVTEAQRDHLRRIDERLRALDKAIGQLLTIARARDLSREIPDVAVDLEELAATIGRTFRAEAQSRGLTLEVSVEPNLPRVASGVDLLAEMMENLLSNALKYTPAGGTVRVSFGRGEPGEVRIQVRDTGIGIPAKEQGRLFQEFFRAANAKRHSAAGTGLGLTLVKQTVERHCGRIRVDSEEGRGTSVTIDLPVQRASPPTPRAPLPRTAVG